MSRLVKRSHIAKDQQGRSLNNVLLFQLQLSLTHSEYLILALLSKTYSYTASTLCPSSEPCTRVLNKNDTVYCSQNTMK